MLDLFQWFYLHKIEGRNPFWKLLELIAESIDENVNNAQVDEIPDVEGAAVGGDDDEEEEEEGEDYEMRVMMRKSIGLTARFAKTYGLERI